MPAIAGELQRSWSPAEAAEAPRSEFQDRVTRQTKKLRHSQCFESYLRARGNIVRMMDDWQNSDPEGGPSAYWKEEIDGFLYMFDASPLIVGKLREQCYHLTSVRSYDYRQHHAHLAPDFVAKFQRLSAIDRRGLFVPESPRLGGFGFDVGPGMANLDTLKFYEVLIGMDKAGLIEPLSKGRRRKVVVEIGSGWGGFAYQLKTLCPRITYVCVDLPPTMLFSSVYLSSQFPDARVLFYGQPDFETEIRRIETYDFVFLPHYYFPRLPKVRVDLGINMVSFQEMTSDQVDTYARALKEHGCRSLYSLNRECSKHNTQMSTVSEILSRYYTLEMIHVLEEQYVHLRPPAKKMPELHKLDYRHYCGRAA